MPMKLLIRFLLFVTIISCTTMFTAEKEISSSTTKEKSDREELGFSNEVKMVIIDDDGFDQKRYIFDRQGNLLYKYNEEGRYREMTFKRYKNDLLVESYHMAARQRYRTYKYNKNKQLTEIRLYQFTRIDFGPDLKMYNPYTGKDVDEDELKLKYIKDENLKYKVQYIYDSNGQRQKTIENEVNYNPMSRAALYGKPSGSHTKNYYNDQGLLIKEVIKNKGGSRWERYTNYYKYDKNKNLVYCKLKFEKNWIILFRETDWSEYFYIYDDRNRLIRTYDYDDSKPEESTQFTEYLYNANGKLKAEITYHLEVNQYAILDPELEVNKGRSRHIQIISRVSDYYTYEYDSNGDIKSKTHYAVRFNQESAKPDNILEYNLTHICKGMKLGTITYKYTYFESNS